jgi:diguanylate cyclase (GGDEF)-like protein/PAS domain S-box-containing protein
MDISGRFVHANATLAAMLGYASPDELLLRVNLLMDVLRDPGRAHVRQALRQGERLEGLQLNAMKEDGTVLRIRLSGRPVRDDTAERAGEWELIIEDLTAQRALEEHLRHLATTDPLTGVANYRRFAEALESEMRRARRTGRGLAVVMLDVDAMKQINDLYGHVAGDRVLRRTADTLVASCRSIDTVARYGGDEFAVVVPETGPEGAAAFEKRLRDRLRSWEPRVSASTGVAVYPRDGETMEQLLTAADHALYRMKAQPRSEPPQPWTTQ